MTTKIIVASITAALLIFSSPVQAKHRYHATQKHYRIAQSPKAMRLGPQIDIAALPAYSIEKTIVAPRQAFPMGRKHIAPSNGWGMADGVKFIPNPVGCSRVHLSCACRLAAYWGLGGGLDAVSTWPRRFRRVSGPAIGIAVVRPGHILGIIGGSLGAWRVADFNSGGHLNREYITAGFGRVIFVDPHSPRSASR